MVGRQLETQQAVREVRNRSLQGGGARQEARRWQGGDGDAGEQGSREGEARLPLLSRHGNPHPIKLQREKKHTRRQTAPYLIHGWERSPRVGIWVILLS